MVTESRRESLLSWFVCGVCVCERQRDVKYSVTQNQFIEKKDVAYPKASHLDIFSGLGSMCQFKSVANPKLFWSLDI